MGTLNLTQHEATTEQREAGVVEPSPKDKEQIKQLLTFNEIPTKTEELVEPAEELALIAERYEADGAMIGGAPFLMSVLEERLQDKNIVPRYAFSRRVSEEHTAEDGTVTKVNTFKHLGFVNPVQ